MLIEKEIEIDFDKWLDELPDEDIRNLPVVRWGPCHGVIAELFAAHCVRQALAQEKT